MECKVLICGAGPVGLTLAIELTRFGVPVRIVDKAASRTDKSKALVIWSRSLELFERAGLTDRFLAAGNKVHGARIRDGENSIADIELGALDTPYPFALMIPQSETERILEEHLLERGVTVERETELTGFVASDAGVVATATSKNGIAQIQAEWLVGCDGAHSIVRHTLGLTFEGSTEMSDWMLADVHLSGGAPNDLLQMFWHVDGVLAVFPMGGGRFRVIGDLGPALSDSRRADPTLVEVQALIDQRSSSGFVAKDPIWLAAFRINERKVERYRHGRVFLAGDAAHIHSPAGGQGMNTGMQDAFNLAWKLVMVSKGSATRNLLDTYSAERSAVGDMVLRNASHMTAAVVLRSPVAQAVRNTAVRFLLGFSQVQRKAASTLSEIDIAYSKSALTSSVGHGHGAGLPGAGERWPPTPGQPKPGAGSVPLFSVAGEANMASVLSTEFPELVASPPITSAGGLRIIRPDGYVGLAAPAGDLDAARRYLTTLRPG